MRAVLLANGDVRTVDVLRPDVPTGSVRVRVVRAGICGTDLELCAGYAEFGGVPGHEFVGVVAADERGHALAGRRVVGEINVACDTCATCLAGRRTHCPSRRVLGIRGIAGAFADEVVLPARNLRVVPDGVSDDQAVFAEPLAAACRIPEQVGGLAGARAVVVGAGRLGLLCAQVLRHAGAEVRVVARGAGSRPCLDALGLVAAEPGLRADVVVDATGSPDGFTAARRWLRPAGTLIVKSTCAGGAVPVDLTSLVVDEITVIGSRCGPLDDALDLLVSGAVDVAPLLEATYPLEEAAAAFAHAARPGALKVLLAPSGS